MLFCGGYAVSRPAALHPLASCTAAALTCPHPTTHTHTLSLPSSIARGLETLVLLAAWKLALPRCVFLLRGNHESATCTLMYGFKGELTAKYGKSHWRVRGWVGQAQLGTVARGEGDAAAGVHAGCRRARGSADLWE